MTKHGTKDQLFEVQKKLSSGTGSPGWSQKRAIKWLRCGGGALKLVFQVNLDQLVPLAFLPPLVPEQNLQG